MASEFGDKLAMIRQYRGLTQAQLADGACTRQQISKYESGISVPKAETVIRFIRRLQYPLSAFAESYGMAEDDTDELGTFALAMAKDKETRQAFLFVDRYLKARLGEFALRHLWGRILEEAEHHPAALAMFKYALLAASETELAECAYRLGRNARCVGDMGAAHEYYAEALLRVGETNAAQAELRNKILNNMATIEWLLSATGMALARFNQSLVLAKSRGDVIYELYAYIGLSSCYLDRKEYEKAYAVLDEAERLCVAARQDDVIGYIHNNQAIVYRHLGEYDKAVALLHESIREKTAHGEESETAYAWNELAEIALAQGDIDKARAYNGKALEIIQRLPNIREQVLAYEFAARLMLLDGHAEKALRFLSRNIDLDRLDSPALRGKVLCLFTEVNLALGDKSASLENIRLLSKLFDSLGKEES